MNGQAQYYIRLGFVLLLIMSMTKLKWILSLALTTVGAADTMQVDRIDIGGNSGPCPIKPNLFDNSPSHSHYKPVFAVSGTSTNLVWIQGAASNSNNGCLDREVPWFRHYDYNVPTAHTVKSFPHKIVLDEGTDDEQNAQFSRFTSLYFNQHTLDATNYQLQRRTTTVIELEGENQEKVGAMIIVWAYNDISNTYMLPRHIKAGLTMNQIIDASDPIGSSSSFKAGKSYKMIFVDPGKIGWFRLDASHDTSKIHKKLSVALSKIAPKQYSQTGGEGITHLVDLQGSTIGYAGTVLDGGVIRIIMGVQQQSDAAPYQDHRILRGNDKTMQIELFKFKTSSTHTNKQAILISSAVIEGEDKHFSSGKTYFISIKNAGDVPASDWITLTFKITTTLTGTALDNQHIVIHDFINTVDDGTFFNANRLLFEVHDSKTRKDQGLIFNKKNSIGMIGFESIRNWEYTDDTYTTIKHKSLALDNPQTSIDLGTNMNGYWKVFKNAGRACYAQVGVDPYCQLRGLKFHSYRNFNPDIYYLVESNKRFEQGTSDYSMPAYSTTCANCLTTVNGVKGWIHRAINIGLNNQISSNRNADPNFKRKFGVPLWNGSPHSWAQYITSTEKVTVEENISSQYADCNSRKWDIEVEQDDGFSASSNIVSDSVQELLLDSDDFFSASCDDCNDVQQDLCPLILRFGESISPSTDSQDVTNIDATKGATCFIGSKQAVYNVDTDTLTYPSNCGVTMDTHKFFLVAHANFNGEMGHDEHDLTENTKISPWMNIVNNNDPVESNKMTGLWPPGASSHFHYAGVRYKVGNDYVFLRDNDIPLEDYPAAVSLAFSANAFQKCLQCNMLRLPKTALDGYATTWEESFKSILTEPEVIAVDFEDNDFFIDLKQFLPPAHRNDAIEHILIKIFDDDNDNSAKHAWKAFNQLDDTPVEQRPLIPFTDTKRIKVQTAVVKAAVESEEGRHKFKFRIIKNFIRTNKLGPFPKKGFSYNFADVFINVDVTDCAGQTYTVPSVTRTLQQNKGTPMIRPIADNIAEMVFAVDRCYPMGAAFYEDDGTTELDPQDDIGIRIKSDEFQLPDNADISFNTAIPKGVPVPQGQKYTFVLKVSSPNPQYFVNQMYDVTLTCLEAQIIEAVIKDPLPDIDGVREGFVPGQIIWEVQGIKNKLWMNDIVEFLQDPAYDCFEIEIVADTAGTPLDAPHESVEVVEDELEGGIDAYLQVNLQKPMYKEIVYVQGKALVGDSVTPVLSVIITNCGSEEIIVKDPDALDPDIELDVQNGKWAEFDLVEVFESSNECIIEEAGVFMDKDGDRPINENQVKIFGSLLMINQNELRRKSDFWLILATPTTFWRKQFTLTFKGKVATTVAALVNTVPTFKSPLPRELDVQITLDAEGNIEGDSIIKYKSPPAIDKEGHKIVMSFSGLEDLQGSMVKLQADGSFTAKLNLNQVKKSGQYILKIELGDEIKAKGSIYRILINVDATQLEPEPEEDEYDEYYDEYYEDGEGGEESEEGEDDEDDEEYDSEEDNSELKKKAAKLAKRAKGMGPKAKAALAKKLEPVFEEYVPEEIEVEYDPDYVYEPYEYDEEDYSEEGEDGEEREGEEGEEGEGEAEEGEGEAEEDQGEEGEGTGEEEEGEGEEDEYDTEAQDEEQAESEGASVDDPERSEASKSAESKTASGEDGKASGDEAPEEEEEEAPPPEPSLNDKAKEEYAAKKAAEEKKKAAQRLRAKGFKRSKAGFVFPGVDLKSLKKPKKAKELFLKEVEEEKPPEPKMKIGAISAKGEAAMDFNREMIAPKGKINQSIYKNVFGMAVTSGMDGSIANGKVGMPKRRLNWPMRLLAQANNEAQLLQFGIEVAEHNGMKIAVRANFDNPNAVSALGPDTFDLKVKELSLFKTTGDTAPLLKSSFPGGDPSIQKITPPMIADEAQADTIANSTASMGTSMNAMTTGNFFISLILGGSMEQLWGMIRALQMIVLIALVQIPIPAPTLVFFQGCIIVANLDVMGGEDWYEANLRFAETAPLNQNFELFGMGDKNFMMNSGSYFLIQILMAAEFFTKKIVSKFSRRYAESAAWRKIGMYFSQENENTRLKNAYLKLFLEAYFDTCFCVFLGLIAFRDSAKEGRLGEHFSSRDNWICSIITISYSVFIIVFPIYVYKIIKNNMGQLQHASVRETYGWLYEGVKIKEKIHAFYNVFFLARRFLTVVVLMFMTDLPFFQCQVLLIFSTVNFIYLASFRPMASKLENKIEIFNELVILLSCHINNCFLNLAIPLSARDQMGWVLMGLAVINIVGNMGIMAKNTTFDIGQSIKDKYYGAQAIRHFNTKMRNRKVLINAMPKKFAAFTEEQEFFEAVEWIKKYAPQRKWMITQGIDFADFKDEKTYQTLNKKFSFEASALKIQFTKALVYAIDKEADNKARKQELEAKFENEQRIIREKARAFLKPVTADEKESELQKALNAPNKYPQGSILNKLLNQRLQKVKEEQQEESKIEKGEVKTKSRRINRRQILRNRAGRKKNLRVTDLSMIEEDAEEQKLENHEQIMAHELSKVRQRPEFAGFKPQVKFFDTNLDGDIEQCKGMLGGKMDWRVKAAVNQEADLYGEAKLNDNQKEARQQVYDDNANFLELVPEVDIQDYGEELHHQLYSKTDQEFVDDLKTNGLPQPKSMTEHSSNGVVAAILQCLLNSAPFIEYILKGESDRHKFGLSTAIKEVAKTKLSKVFSMSKSGHNVGKVTEYLRDIVNVFEVKYGAKKVLQEVFALLQAEDSLRSDPSGSKNLYTMIQTRFTRCQQDHRDESHKSIEIHDLQVGEPIINQFEEIFTSFKTKEECKECALDVKIKGYRMITQVPLILVLNFEIFNQWDMQVHKKEAEVTDKLNISKFIDTWMTAAGQPSDYTLSSIVFFKGEELDEGRYVTVIRYEDKLMMVNDGDPYQIGEGFEIEGKPQILFFTLDS